MSKPSDSVLYFPSIEFQSDEWVKSSLLFWDKIYRIVPQGYTPCDSATVLEATRHGLIKNISLDERDKENAAKKFMEFYERLPLKPAGLEIRQHHRINVGKIDDRLYPLLGEIAQKWYNEDWYYVPEPIARGYMFYLSKIAADRRNISRATDNRDSWTVSPYFVEKGNFSENVYDSDAKTYYSTLLIDDLIPANISEVPIGEIITFLEDRSDLKAELRLELFEFGAELSRCDSEDFTKEVIEAHKGEIENKKTDLKKSAGFWNSTNLFFLFSVGLPISNSVYKAFADPADPFSIYNISSSCFIGAVAAYSNYRIAKKKERGNSYLSYLIDMDKQFVGTKRYPNYSYLMNEFIND